MLKELLTVCASWKDVLCNPCQSSPSLFCYGLELSLNYYFQAFFSLKVILNLAKSNSNTLKSLFKLGPF